MSIPVEALDADALAFLTERHLATLTTLNADGTPHVVPVAYSYVPHESSLRIVATAGSVKVRNSRRGCPGVLCFVDGGRWMSLHGRMNVRDDDDRVADTLARYTERYGPPHGALSDRVSLELNVEFARGRFRR
jgi:PPOX class probable F420-dependent enzyme